MLKITSQIFAPLAKFEFSRGNQTMIRIQNCILPSDTADCKQVDHHSIVFGGMTLARLSYRESLATTTTRLTVRKVRRGFHFSWANRGVGRRCQLLALAAENFAK